MPHFQIREARFDTGEHYPFLMRDGEPMFYPCVYTTCMLRGRNLAYNTPLRRHQNSIKQLYTWASISKIDVESRTRTGAFFEEREIDAIVRACRAPYETLVKLLEERKPKAPQRRQSGELSAEGATRPGGSYRTHGGDSSPRHPRLSRLVGFGHDAPDVQRLRILCRF